MASLEANIVDGDCGNALDPQTYPAVVIILTDAVYGNVIRRTSQSLLLYTLIWV